MTKSVSKETQNRFVDMLDRLRKKDPSLRLKTIAEEMELSIPAAKIVKVGAGIEPNSRGRQKGSRNKNHPVSLEMSSQIVDLYRAGKTEEEIAAVTRVNRNRVQDVLKEYGVEKRPHGRRQGMGYKARSERFRNFTDI